MQSRSRSKDTSPGGASRGAAGLWSLAALLVACIPAPTAAQTGSITGQVVDASSGRPLTEAQITVVGSRAGGLTNAQGRYLLTAVPLGQHTVRVELIGYSPEQQTVTVTAGSPAVANFQLGQTAISLNEIIVTGQGQATERRRLGTTVDVINEQAIQAAPVTTVQDLLQGRVAGATVSATSSQPGTGSLINFRGISSVFASQTPVIYIDGVRVDNDQSTAASTGGEQSSALADLLTSDIERIEVTRGGAASTLYGSDAATGVIQIFTKKGRPGRPVITARMEQGLQTPDLKYIFDAGVIFADLVEAGDASPTFMEDNFFRDGHIQNYYLGASGGSGDVTYNVSGRIEQGDGVQPKNGNVNFNLRAGLQAEPTERLRLQFSGNYTRADFERLFNGAAIADPLTTFEVGDALFFSGANNLEDALDIFLMPDINEEVQRWTFSTGAFYDFSDMWSARANVGIDNRNSHQRVLEPIGFTPGEVEGELNSFRRTFTSVSLDVASTLNNTIGASVTSAFTVGVQGFREDEELISASGTGFALPGAPDFDEAAEIDASEANSEVFNGGIFLDEQLGLWDRLFLGAGVRFDAGSAFGDEVSFEVYPKATAAYVLSEEDFFRGGFLGSVVDEFKLRAAYGETGKFPEPFLKDLTFNATSFRGESAPRFDNPGNEELSPEVTRTIEGGVDVALFSNRLGLNFTYFDALTSDALFFVPEQPVTGQGEQLRNIGEISNTGIELAANLQVLNRPNLAWSIGGTFHTVDNEVVDMGGAPDFFVEGQKLVREDMPVGAWFVTTPFDSNGDGLPDASRREFIQVGGQCSEGELTAADPLGDACEVARPTPTHSGSFNTQVTLWNNLSLSALSDWARGHHVMDFGSVWSTFNQIYRREEIEGVDFPVQYNADGSERGRYSQSAARSAFIYDGDWFKLREVSVRYALPQSLTGSFGGQRGSIYGSVRNVWTWSENVLVDPELNGLMGSGDGLVLGSESSITLSPPRTFRFGIEVVF